jgi:hypothetical protein
MEKLKLQRERIVHFVARKIIRGSEFNHAIVVRSCPSPSSVFFPDITVKYVAGGGLQ